MEINEKTQNLITDLGAVGLGILAWENEATLKWAKQNEIDGIPYSLFSKLRLADAIAGIAGKGTAKAIFPEWQGVADFKPNWFGWANPTVLLSGVLNVVNGAIKDNVKQYKNFPVVPDFVHKATIATAIGAAVGGIFDPDPADYKNQTNPSNNTNSGIPVVYFNGA